MFRPAAVATVTCLLSSRSRNTGPVTAHPAAHADTLDGTKVPLRITGYFWAISRDDRPWGGLDPPAVVYTYAPGRGAEHATALLAGYCGIVHCDGYTVYKQLADPDRDGGTVPLAIR